MTHPIKQHGHRRADEPGASRHRSLVAIWHFVWFLPLLACGGLRVYTDPGIPGALSEVVLDKGLHLLKIDDTSLEGRQPKVGVRYDALKLAPGMHTLEVVYFDSRTVPDPPETIELNIETNKRYRLILDVSPGLGKQRAAVIAEDASTGEWLLEAPAGIPKSYIVESANTVTAAIHVREIPDLKLPSTGHRVVSEIHSSNGAVVYRIAPVKLKHYIAEGDVAKDALTRDAETVAYRETVASGGTIALKKITEIRKNTNGAFHAVGFIAVAASELRLKGTGANASERTIPKGATLRVVFGRIFAVEEGATDAADGD